MKLKIFSFFLCFILIFNLFSFSVFAESPTPSDWEPSWVSTIRAGNGRVQESLLKIIYNDCVNKPLAGFSSTLATYDAGSTVVGAGMSYFVSLIKAGNSPQQALSIMQSDINSNNGNTSITGSGNTYITSYYDSVADNSNIFTTFYCAPWTQVPVNAFSTPETFNCVRNSIKVYNGYIFYLTWNQNDNYSIRVLNLSDCLGLVYPSHLWGTPYPDAPMYDTYWTTTFENEKLDPPLFIYCPGTLSDWQYFSVNGYAPVIYDSDGLLDIPAMMENASRDRAGSMYFNNSGVSFDWWLADPTVVTGMAFCGTGQEIEVFNTLAALKRGSVGMTQIQALPTFNGQGINADSITDSQIQQADEIINNYYSDPGGGGGSSDPGGGGSSSDDDSGSDSLWKVLASAVKNLINFVVDVLGSAIGALTDLLDKLVGFFSNARELVGSGFADFVAAFFPYLPEEWITLVSLSIGLVLFFWVLKKFT